MTTHKTLQSGLQLSPFHATALTGHDEVDFVNCLKVGIIVQYAFKLKK